MEPRPFSEDDLNSAPVRPDGGRTRKPKVRWDPEPADPMVDLLRVARSRDAESALHYRNLQGAQFGPGPGTVEGYEQAVNDGGQREPISQENWQRGMGDTWTERHFSPRARAQGHLLGAAAMFVAAAPPLVDRGRVTDIRY